jgi:NADH-quinone oxidoreductase subunit M
MPIFATIFMIVTLSSIGLPGTNGFVGEFLVLLGAYQNLQWYTVVATSGVILSAVYMLWMFQRVMFGELNNPKNKVLTDLNAREIAIMVPLVVMIFVMGVFPTPFLDKMAPAIDKLVMQVNQKRVASVAIPQPVLSAPSAATIPETQSPIK